MCVFKYHAFIYFLRPPPWYGTCMTSFNAKNCVQKISCQCPFNTVYYRQVYLQPMWQSVVVRFYYVRRVCMRSMWQSAQVERQPGLPQENPYGGICLQVCSSGISLNALYYYSYWLLLLLLLSVLLLLLLNRPVLLCPGRVKIFWRDFIVKALNFSVLSLSRGYLCRM
jgi:hypothetical protein